jgi:hypothetical protein
MSETEYRLGAPHIDQDNRIRLQSPLLLTAPAVTGTLSLGQTLTCALGTYRVGAVVSGEVFRWYRNGLPIAGATATTYVIAAADINQRIRCRVSVNYAGFWKRWFSNTVIPL